MSSVETIVDNLHREVAKIADMSDAPHGLPLPCTIDPKRSVSLSYAMREYDEGLRYMRERTERIVAAETATEAAVPSPENAAFVCTKRNMFTWEINGWPVRGYVTLVGEYECEEDGEEGDETDARLDLLGAAGEVQRTKKKRDGPKLLRRWISRRDLVGEKLNLMLDAWAIRFGAVSVEAELAAQAYLLKRLSEKQRRSYILGGSFVEESKRSHVAYLLRKGLPTLAFGKDNKFLCALCLHSFGAFMMSYVGLMPPSDEVLAHLLLNRGDQEKFLKKSGQHPAWNPMSGV